MKKKVIITSYELQSLKAEDEEFDSIIGLLKSSDYRQSALNLLPWHTTSVSTGSSKSVQVFLARGTDEAETCYLVIHENGQIHVMHGADDGIKVYYATARDLCSRLVAYLEKNGE